MICKRLTEVIGLSKKNQAADISDAVSAIAFDDLGIEQTGVDAPGAAAFVSRLNPSAEMGGQRVEVESQAIPGEDGKTASRQLAGDIVDQLMGGYLSAGADGEGGD